ncbi:MAG: four helix bundle protein [Chitinophagaceae bacterium]
MSEFKSYKQLDAWIRARNFVKEIYIVTREFPKEELYGFVSQMRRCAVSVPSNIAEGYGRQYKKETLHFLHIARGSLYELETQLYLASDLSYIGETRFDELIIILEECRKLLNGLIKYFEDNLNLK